MTEEKATYKAREKKKKVRAVIVLVKDDGRLVVSIDGNNCLLDKEESKKYREPSIGKEIEV